MQNEESDDELIAATAKGDTQAFRRLTTRHLPRCYAIARRILSSPHDAEEAAQEAFTKVWMNASRFEPGRASFSTWFYRMIVNTCIDQQRRRPPTASPIEMLAEVLPDNAPSAETQLAAAGQSDKIKRAVQALPDRQRMAITLCYFEEFTNAQAAASMNMHVKALEGLLVRARRSLRESLRNIESRT